MGPGANAGWEHRLTCSCPTLHSCHGNSPGDSPVSRVSTLHKSEIDAALAPGTLSYKTKFKASLMLASRVSGKTPWSFSLPVHERGTLPSFTSVQQKVGSVWENGLPATVLYQLL